MLCRFHAMKLMCIYGGTNMKKDIQVSLKSLHPRTLHPTPYTLTLHPRLDTRNPKPYSRNKDEEGHSGPLKTLHPPPSTLHPKPYALYHALSPYTLHPRF